MRWCMCVPIFLLALNPFCFFFFPYCVSSFITMSFCLLYVINSVSISSQLSLSSPWLRLMLSPSLLLYFSYTFSLSLSDLLCSVLRSRCAARPLSLMGIALSICLPVPVLCHLSLLWSQPHRSLSLSLVSWSHSLCQSPWSGLSWVSSAFPLHLCLLAFSLWLLRCKPASAWRPVFLFFFSDWSVCMFVESSGVDW